MKYLIILLCLASIGCAELHQHILGTRVHQFTVKDTQYVHCSVMMSPQHAQMALDAIRECQDALVTAPQPQPHR